MTMFRRSMHWLGLGPDDDYDYDYDESYDDEFATTNVPGPAEEEVRVMATSPIRPVPRPLEEPPSGGRAAVRSAGVAAVSAPPAKPLVVVPASFDQAQEVADTFKSSVPVIVNLQGAERDLSRRLIDFASGLCYGLGGHMEKVANQVYLLTPSDVTVSPEDRRQLRERGLSS